MGEHPEKGAEIARQKLRHVLGLPTCLGGKSRKHPQSYTSTASIKILEFARKSCVVPEYNNVACIRKQLFGKKNKENIQKGFPLTENAVERIFR